MMQLLNPHQFASSIVLPNIGDPFQGGFYAGLISHTANGIATHALIVAPAATGATGTGYPVTTGLSWKTANTSTPGATSPFDGVANMAAVVAAGIANHPAFQFCYSLTIGGFNDWYLPSTREHDVAYFNLKPTTDANNTTAATANPYAVPSRNSAYAAGGPPVQTTVAAFQSPNGAERFATGATGNNHLTSTEQSVTEGARFAFETGFNGVITKSSLRAVRAFRRIAL
jgi:hypothetical protein